MVIVFYDVNEVSAGAVYFEFGLSPKYTLLYCLEFSSLLPFPTALPTEEKVWRITLTRTLGIRGVVIQCNKKVVLNVTMSGTTCEVADWNTYWSRDVKRIGIPGTDSATEFYRPGNGK